MVRQIWFASDHHLFHRNILIFQDDEGELIRKFDNIEQHNDCILTNHNERVKDGDIVYWMGDVAITREGDDLPSLLNKFKGKRRLLPGNHDDIKKLAPLFSKVQIWRVFRDDAAGYIPFTLTHVPIDKFSIKGRFNGHGHIHQNESPTPYHINLCMEATNFCPVSFDELQETMKERLRGV
jgi:calcineurin-like phosphoesterase family protein